jgi:hypothetical protein
MAEAFSGPPNNRRGSSRFTAKLTEEQRARCVTLGSQAATETDLPADPSFRAAPAPTFEWDSREAMARAAAGPPGGAAASPGDSQNGGSGSPASRRSGYEGLTSVPR